MFCLFFLVFLQCFLFFCKIVGYAANHLCPFHLIQIFAVIFRFLWAYRCELRLNKISQHHKIIITTRCFPHELRARSNSHCIYIHQVDTNIAPNESKRMTACLLISHQEIYLHLMIFHCYV